jgi:KUP system potassium uptake protein
MSEQRAAVKRSALVVGALGVVYGDIGTSPLYAFREAFIEEAHVLTVDRINVYGVCSLAFWALVMIISLKYLFFVMKADNHGEGGILALTSLVMQRKGSVVKAGLLVSLGVFGTALLYGDGIITPAISGSARWRASTRCRPRSSAGSSRSRWPSSSVCSACRSAAPVPSAECSGRS